MVSAVSSWRDGVLSWSVVRDCESGLLNLEETGTLPADYPSIRARAIERQEASVGQGVDYLFDVPVELAQSLVGYRHDEDVEGAGEEPFEVLAGR